MRQLKIGQSITNKDNLVDKYLLDIGKIELITASEEVELAQRIKAGDEKALEKLVNANLRFVVSVAKQHQNQGLTLPDLINEGNIGLIKAAQRFDETQGFKFISYAVWWIRQKILQAIAEQGKMVRLPMNQQGELNKINKMRDLLEQNLQRTPLNQEIIEALDMNWEKRQPAMSAPAQVFSLDVPLTSQDRETSALSDTISSTMFPQPDSLVETEYFKKEIANLLTTLSQKEEFVLTHYFGIGKAQREHTFEEISRSLGCTPEAARQMKEKAIRRLKRQTTTQKKYESLKFS